METNPLVGKTVVAVYLAEDGKAIKFDIADGDPIVARADGDCCSDTWIEHVETPENLLGTVSKVEDIDMPQLEWDRNEFEELAFYGCKIQATGARPAAGGLLPRERPRVQGLSRSPDQARHTRLLRLIRLGIRPPVPAPRGPCLSLHPPTRQGTR